VRELSVFDRHQLKIARDTLKLDDTVAALHILGGPDKDEARAIIRRITGRAPVEKEDCL